MTHIKTRIVGVVICVLAAVFFLVPPTDTAYAVSNFAFDNTNVLEDLQSSKTLDDEPFDITKYPFNEKGQLQVINIVEYCYSFRTSARAFYGVYLYVYNPQGLNISMTSIMNKVQLADVYKGGDVVNGEPTQYNNYDMQFCSRSTGDVLNLFYKFKIKDRTGPDGKKIVERVNSMTRRYDISSIDLLTEGKFNADPYTVGMTALFTGYAVGCGSDASAASTLAYEFKTMETIEIEVKSTWYRPEGESQFGTATQDQLNSVYFAIPNEYIEKYQHVYAVHVEWYEYLTREIFVQGNYSVYNKLRNYLGKQITPRDENVQYVMSTNRRSVPMGGFYADIADDSYNWQFSIGDNIKSKDITMLSYLFSTGISNAYDYSISSQQLKEYWKWYSGNIATDNSIRGKYSADLFYNAVDSGRAQGYNNTTVTVEDKLSLTSEVVNRQSWWEKLWNIKNVTSTTYDGIEGVKMLSKADITTPAETCQRLYIADADYTEFKGYYDKALKENKTITLLRFAVTNYVSKPVRNEEIKKILGAPILTAVDNNAYMAQQTAFLDFDVIDITFYNKGNFKVIPTVSAPIDLVGGVTPPVENPDENWWDKLTEMLLIFLLIILAVVFLPVLIRGAIWLLKLPFRVIDFFTKSKKKR